MIATWRTVSPFKVCRVHVCITEPVRGCAIYDVTPTQCWGGVSGLVVEYRTRNFQVESHCGLFASILKQVANLRCAQVNSASYPSKWVVAYGLRGEGLVWLIAKPRLCINIHHYAIPIGCSVTHRGATSLAAAGLSLLAKFQCQVLNR